MRSETIGDAVLYCGDCMDVAAILDAESIDALVSDPPYGIDFMGKDWDRGVPGLHFWKAFFRIVKPGAHLLAFGGTRTFHRQVTAIEDAGWEVRDLLGWLYGSGFPKSMDVSKAIDRCHVKGDDGDFEWRSKSPIDGDVYTVTAFVRVARDKAGKSNREIDQLFGFNGMAGHWTSAASQPSVPTWPQWERLKEFLGMTDEMDELVVAVNGGKGDKSIEGTALAEREVVGMAVGKDCVNGEIYAPGGGEYIKKVYEVTAARTEAAKAWEGWGTALKPAWEPICLARKPLVGSVAGNVMRYGTGAINIDGCRIGGGEERETLTGGMARKAAPIFGKFNGPPPAPTTTLNGRWPANIMQDGSDEVIDLFPTDGEASAARFFYTAKASRDDRDEGIDGRNIHPTVKPTDLMRWLVRLIAATGAVVFDPFMGSGSTGKAAMLEGRRFIGAELSPEYFDIACRRIEAAYKAARRQLSLFDEFEATRGKAADILQPSLF